MSERRARVLSGIQPSGTKHLGNYFGAMRQFVALQEEHPGECFFFIADYHALTTLRDAEALRTSVVELAATYLAVGIDPAKACLFRQSDVPEVTELTWLLATVTGMGLLERATSYKDKVDRGIKPNVGLFTYPVLMAADILLYDATLVPVGKDQVQHLEMTQDMATHFNEAFGAEALVRPDWRLSRFPKVPGTDGQKMSTSYGNTIPLFETGKRLKKRVGQVVTDSTPLGAPLDPRTCNVFALLELFVDEAQKKELERWYRTGERDGAPFGYGHAKARLVEEIEAHFAAARSRRDHLLAHPHEVEAVLRDAADRARLIARETISRCKRACGLA
ncbi:MAG: tryptophan--tRNA ligase [Myxococcota bacterium]